MAEHVLFLGAGSSYGLGFPLTREFTSTFQSENEFSVKMNKELCDAKAKIMLNKFDYDVENLLDYLQGHSNPRYYMKTGGSFRASTSKIQPITCMKPRNAAIELKSKLEGHMIRKCYLSPQHLRPLARMFYDRLLSKISGENDWKNKPPNFNKNLFEIFTTNFDNSIDVYADELGPKATRGFLKNKNDEVTFEPNFFESNYYKLKIFKLHGSVELSKLEDGRIVSTDPPKGPGLKFGASKIITKVMVYGIDKNLYSEPYLELLLKLKKSLINTDKCYVIGYSFRDPWIQKIFEEAIAHNDDLRIEVISPSAKIDIQKYFLEIKNKFIPKKCTITKFLKI